MADQPIEVVIELAGEDVLTGRLYSYRRRGSESASFVYETAYLGRPDAYALDPALPLTQGTLQTPVGLQMFRAFGDATPDRWGRRLISRAEQQRATVERTTPRSLGEIDFLLGVRDDLRQGAVRFRDPTSGRFLAAADIGVPVLTDLPRLVEAAEHFESDEETDAELFELLRVGSSLGGARPKAHVVDADGRVAIAKFPSALHDTWNVMAWEKVSLDLARKAGIRVPHSRLLWLGKRSVLIINRFDREGTRRIGYVSALTMLEASDGDLGSYLDIAAVIEQVSPRASDDLQELWRRIAFSILISNTDDHLRNHGFLHAGAGTWTLSPAFDLNPNPEPGTKHLSTAIDGHDTTASIQLLLTVAGLFRLTDVAAADALAEALAATEQWRAVASGHGITESEIANMAPAFEHSETDAARTLLRLAEVPGQPS
jgi:serine/threonine-protein kinase HipA